MLKHSLIHLQEKSTEYQFKSNYSTYQILQFGARLHSPHQHKHVKN